MTYSALHRACHASWYLTGSCFSLFFSKSDESIYFIFYFLFRIIEEKFNNQNKFEVFYFNYNTPI